MIEFGGVIRKRDARIIRPGWMEIRAPLHLVLLHDPEGNVAFRNDARHYFFLESDDSSIREGIEAWIPPIAEYPHSRHRVEAAVLATVCPPHKGSESVVEAHEVLWATWPWGSAASRQLCRVVLTNRIACIQVVEFSRGVALANSVFTSVIQTTEHRSEVIKRWVATSYAIRGDLANVVQSVFSDFLADVQWQEVQQFMIALAGITPISRLPVHLRIKKWIIRR